MAVLAQSEKLPKITKTHLNWAFRECIDHYAHRLPKGRTTCMDCGHSWVMEREMTSCRCPKCRAKLDVRTSYVRKLQQKQYFTILTTCGGYQVLRMFLLIVEMEKGCKAKPYALEIGQYWWNDKGRKAIVAIQRVMGHYLDTFSFCSPMAIRDDNIAYDHISYSPIYPKFQVIDTLKRNGLNEDYPNIVPTQLIPALLTNSKAETLMKAQQYSMLKYYLKSSFNINDYWSSIKICIRNGYTITDASMWRDYIDLLRYFGKDTNNPKYVCPTDLKAEHDIWVAKKNKIMEKEREQQRIRMAQRRIEAERQKAERLERAKTEYALKKANFLDLNITDGFIFISVLQNVEDFYEEGKAMHHCVYSNEYYNRDNSLILSARIDGKRVETIEVNLENLSIIQSRGACNQDTEYHDRIVSLVNKNMKLIRKRMAA